MKTSAEFRAALERKFAPPAWSIAYEVRSAVGFGKVRSADALALANWESRGCRLLGFEIKVSVSDLRRELADPTKSEEIARFCHAWSLVAPAEVIAATEAEIPPHWGLLVPRGEVLVQKRPPTPRHNPDAWTPIFVASLIRSFSNDAVSRYDATLVDDALKRAEKERELAGRERAIRRAEGGDLIEKLNTLRTERDTLNATVEEIRRVSGCWSTDQFRAVLRTVGALNERRLVQEIRSIGKSLLEVATALETPIADLATAEASA